MTQEPKRIAIFIDALSGGGAEKSMLSLAKTLSEMGHKPFLFPLTYRLDYELPNDVPIKFLYTDPKRKLRGNAALSQASIDLMHLVKEVESSHGEFDLHLSNLMNTHKVVLDCEFSNCHYILHSPIEAVLKKTLRSNIFKYFSLKNLFKKLSSQNIITVSKGMENEISQGDLIKPAAIRTIYNPINFSEIVEKSNENAPGLPELPYIIHVGRSVGLKRHDLLFKAVKSMDTKIKLVCLTSKPKKLKRLGRKYGIAEQLILPGFQKNPYPWIKHASALVLCSDFEGFGNVLVEAIACGTTPISTDCPHGPAEILTGPLSSLLVKKGDFAMLGNTIEKALGESFDLSKLEILQTTSARHVASEYLALCGLANGNF